MWSVKLMQQSGCGRCVVYPVSSLGAAKQLKHILPENRPYVLNLVLKEMGLEEYGTNAVEGSLCETSERGSRQSEISLTMCFQDRCPLCFQMGRSKVLALCYYQSEGNSWVTSRESPNGPSTLFGVLQSVEWISALNAPSKSSYKGSQ